MQIDQLLAGEFEKHPANIEAGIVTTVLAFPRGDRDATERRLQKLSDRVAATKPGHSDIALWLVARLALDDRNTAIIGEKLATRALVAAANSGMPRVAWWTKRAEWPALIVTTGKESERFWTDSAISVTTAILACLMSEARP